MQGSVYYTLQNARGKVYGTGILPEEAGLTPQQWEDALGTHIHDILGLNGVLANRLPLDHRTGEEVERVTIDIDPDKIRPGINERIQSTIGFIAMGEPEGLQDLIRSTTSADVQKSKRATWLGRLIRKN